MKPIRNYLLPGIILVLMAFILNACGGGGSASTSGSSNSVATASSSGGAVSGTVTGFGSIVVDGQEYPETAGTSYQTDSNGAPGMLAADGIQLGQQVILSLDGKGNISQVVVAPDVQGTVTSTSSAVIVGSGTSVITLPAITVSGVLVVANSDSSQGPVTNFGGGYTALSSVAVGDNAEVHGLLQSANGVDYVQATYIGKQPNFSGTRITGTVSNYVSTAANGTTFNLGTVAITATGATIKPDGDTVANGDIVSVWSSGSLSGNALTASIVLVRNHLGVAGQTVAVSGAISNYVSPSSFVVSGLTVDASSVTLPPDIAALGNGMVVAVSGALNSAGTLVATRVRVYKSQENVAPPVMLQGSISNFVSTANFTVRGVVVDASQSPSFETGYGASNLTDGTWVVIQGTLSNNVVVATSINFVTIPTTAVIDVNATVQGYVPATGALTISVTLPGAHAAVTDTVTLGSSVTYNNGSASSLAAGQRIAIHAIYDTSSQTLTVETITFLPAPPASVSPGSRPVVLGGLVTAVTTTNGTVTAFVVQGLTVQVGSASVQTVSGASATLAVGEPVAVAATASAGNTLTAVQIFVAPPRSQPGTPDQPAPSGTAASGATS